MGAAARWPLRTAGLLIVFGASAVLALAMRAALHDATVSDRFQVLDVISEGALRRHAVVYRHDGAGGSGTSFAVWIIDGPAPEKGTADRPVGRPVAIWREGVPRLGWRAGRLRLIGGPHLVRAEAEDVATCPFGPAATSATGPAADLCLDPRFVTFVPLPR